MTEEKLERKDDRADKEQETAHGPLRFCTTAASAEHMRASDEDEPCDDARSAQ
jgi:hypothetical protein